MRVDNITGKPCRWAVANGNEIHDRETEFDERGARIGETANRIAKIEWPYGDPEGQHAIACKMAAAEDMERLIARMRGQMELMAGVAHDSNLVRVLHDWIHEMGGVLNRAQGKAADVPAPGSTGGLRPAVRPS